MSIGVDVDDLERFIRRFQVDDGHADDVSHSFQVGRMDVNLKTIVTSQFCRRKGSLAEDAALQRKRILESIKSESEFFRSHWPLHD